MDTSISALMGLVRETFADPRAAARAIMALNLPMAARWQALALVVIMAVLVGHAAALLMLGAGDMLTALGVSPLVSALVQAVALLAMGWAAHHVGGLMGGRGTFADALLLVIWLQAVMILVQLAQVVALIVVPPFAGILSLLGMVLFLWLLTNFVAELHGFESLGKVFAMVIVTGVGLAFAAAMVLTLLGLAPAEMG